MEKKLVRTYAKHKFNWERSSVAKIQEDLDALKSEGVDSIEIETEWDTYDVTFRGYYLRDETDKEFKDRKAGVRQDSKIKQELELLAKLEEKYYGKQR